ncbi:MAG: membrane protein insertase YidC [Muribaculaceae bacterium]|nr:membrane protein insertase YidC [Muribaculaceae bacterium]
MGNNNNNNSTLLIMMLLMVVTFFAISQCNRKQSQAEQQQAKTEATIEPAALDTNAAAQLVSIAQQFGKEAGADTMRLAVPEIELLAVSTSDSTAVAAGTVMMADTAYAIEALLGKVQTGAPMTGREQDACKKLAAMLTTYGGDKYLAPHRYGTEQTCSLTSADGALTLTFNTKGGIIESATLNKYDKELGDDDKADTVPVELFNAKTGAYSFEFPTRNNDFAKTSDLYFDLAEKTDTSVVMKLDFGDNVYWQIRYTLNDRCGYIVNMQIEQNGILDVLAPGTTTGKFAWHQLMARNEKGRSFENRNSALYYKTSSKGPKDLNSNKTQTKNDIYGAEWFAFKNQFFSSVIIADQPFKDASATSVAMNDNQVYVKEMTVNAEVPYDLNNPRPLAFNFYFGPNSYETLSDIDKYVDAKDDLDLNRLVPLGWGPMRWINQLIIIPVFNFLSKFISNYGIIILLLTIFIKLIIFPFTWKSYMSQAKMRVLAPEIKEINEKYPGNENAMKRQQETMALYGRVGASPFSGCLPMLLQMPILIAMFSFFPSAIELRGQSFLWAHDLSAPDSILTLPFTIPFYGNHVSLFCLLMTITNIIYARISMQNNAAAGPQQGMMKWMMYLMPVMFLFIFNDYASGLSYYYFLSLLITIVQTWIFRKCINEKKVRAELLENAKKPKKKSGFMARLQEMQKAQEAQMRQQAKENAKKRR